MLPVTRFQSHSAKVFDYFIRDFPILLEHLLINQFETIEYFDCISNQCTVIYIFLLSDIDSYISSYFILNVQRVDMMSGEAFHFLKEVKIRIETFIRSLESISGTFDKTINVVLKQFMKH